MIVFENAKSNFVYRKERSEYLASERSNEKNSVEFAFGFQEDKYMSGRKTSGLEFDSIYACDNDVVSPESFEKPFASNRRHARILNGGETEGRSNERERRARTIDKNIIIFKKTGPASQQKPEVRLNQKECYILQGKWISMRI